MAAVPVVYGTADLALRHRAQLKPGGAGRAGRGCRGAGPSQPAAVQRRVGLRRGQLCWPGLGLQLTRPALLPQAKRCLCLGRGAAWAWRRCRCGSPRRAPCCARLGGCLAAAPPQLAVLQSQQDEGAGAVVRTPPTLHQHPAPPLAPTPPPPPTPCRRSPSCWGPRWWRWTWGSPRWSCCGRRVGRLPGGCCWPAAAWRLLAACRVAAAGWLPGGCCWLAAWERLLAACTPLLPAPAAALLPVAATAASPPAEALPRAACCHAPGTCRLPDPCLTILRCCHCTPSHAAAAAAATPRRRGRGNRRVSGQQGASAAQADQGRGAQGRRRRVRPSGCAARRVCAWCLARVAAAACWA
jgi:hypothetical protein